MTKLISKILRLFGIENETYYINGASTLPPPLSPEEEAKHIENISDPNSKKTLIEHNLRLVVYIAKKYHFLCTATWNRN